ncbi:MAG: hypothetical protein KDD40_09940 [Bdellovibrionales bacterium]|nr:hypothetical protein [Bdellovibrionales bacterium]
MKNKTFLLFAHITFLILLQACGKDESGNTVQALEAPTPGYSVFWGSCDNTAVVVSSGKELAVDVDKNCREWYGEFFATINLIKACDNVPGGVLTQDHCSEADLLGVCSVPIGIDSETRYYYYKSHWLLESALLDCDAKDASAQWLAL